MATDWTLQAQLFLDGVWGTINAHRIAANVPVKVERGTTEAGELRPSKITWRVLDPNDTFRPSNPQGAYYGQLVQYLAAAFAVAGSTRSTGEVATYKPDETHDHSTEVLASWDFEGGTQGWVGIDATAGPATDPEHDGVLLMTVAAGGGATQAYVQPGAAVAVTEGQVVVGRLLVYYPLGGTVTAALDFSNSGGYVGGQYPSWPVPASTWTEIIVAGQVPAGVTLASVHPTLGGPPPNGTQLYLARASLTDTSPASRRGVRWVDMEVNGPLRRIGQWDDPLQSTMRHQIGGYAELRGYWPLEDQRDAERLLNASAGGGSGYHSGVTLGGADGPAGSDKVLKLGTGGLFGGQFEMMPADNNGWQLFLHINALATSGTDLPIFQWNTSDGATWTWHQSTTGYRLIVTNRLSVVLLDQASTHGAGAEDGQWITFRWKVYRTGTTINVETGWNPENTGVLYGFALGTFTGGAMRPTSWRVNQNANNLDGAYAHIGGVYGQTVNLQSTDFRDAFNGYRGEGSLTRYQRLMGQAGLGWQRLGFLADGVKMGPQPVATLMELLKEIRETEDALVFDRRDANAVTIRGRRQMMNQAPALALTWPDNVSGLREVTDDLGVFNDVTVANRNGGEARAVLETGPMSVDEIGRVVKTVNVNVDESQVDLAQLAGYYLSKFTVAGARYSSVLVDLDAHPELEAAALAVDVGSIITVDGRTPDQLVLRVLGILETVTRKRRTLEFTVEPATIWRGGIYDDPFTRADARGHQITGGPFLPGAGAITVDFTTGPDADGLAWTHADGDYDIVVSGERMTVTGVALGSPHMTLFVRRSVNGVARTLTAGASVQLADPARYWR